MTHDTNTPTGLVFLAGISAGALAALLFAPRSGSETRHQLKEAAINAHRKAQETVDEQANRVETKIDEAMDEASQLMENGKAIASDIAAEKLRRVTDKNP